MLPIKRAYYIVCGIKAIIKFRLSLRKTLSDCDTLLIFPYYHIGGAEKVHLNIAKSLANKKKLAILFTNKSLSSAFMEAFGNYASILDIPDILSKNIPSLNNILQNQIADAINASPTTQLFGCNSRLFYKILPMIRSRIKIYDLVHAVTDDSEFNRFLIKSAPSIQKRVAINLHAKQQLIKLYEENCVHSVLIDNIEIIENGIDLQAYDFKEKRVPSTLDVGFVGRWSHEKGPDIFLAVAKHLMGNNKFSFKMAGPNIDSNIENLNVYNVAYVGVANNEREISDIYNNLHILLITSRSEGFPLVIMEAMAFGVIPICRNVGGIAQHVKHSENGFLITSDDETNIATKFSEIINFISNNPREYSRISNNCILYARQFFDMITFDKKYKRLFQS